jgi:hypothetical protein
LIAAVAAVSAVGLFNTAAASAASGNLSIATQPGLYPGFNSGITDYVVRCTGAPVQVTVSTPSNTRSSVDGQPSRKGSYTTQVALTTGQGFSVTTDGPGNGRSDSVYYVRCLPSDYPTWTTQRPGQPQADFYTVAPFARADLQPFPANWSNKYASVFDNNGVPIWWTKSSSALVPFEFHFLSNGNVIWTHLNQPGAEEHSLDGSLVRTVDTVGIGSDEHEALLLSNGNYLLQAYKPKCCYDLTPYGGPSNATIVDAEVQELTPAGALVWKWDASDHIPLSEVPRDWWNYILRPAVTVNGAWDVYHLNSMEPTGGDLLLSFRHLDAVYRINKSSGDILWKLSGTHRPESLTVVGDPIFDSGSEFGGQHDARELSDGTITVHDNGYQWSVRRKPRAVRYRIDTTAKTATLVEQVTDPGTTTAGCCGSARKLPGGDWVADWGQNDGIRELTAGGALVFGLTWDNSLFSYRAHPVLPGAVSRTALRAGMNAQYPR